MILYMVKSTKLSPKFLLEFSSINDSILQYAMKDSGLVKGRDFVTSRMYRRVDDVVLEAARSFETKEIERYKKKTRFVQTVMLDYDLSHL